MTDSLPDSSSKWQRTTTRRFLRWLFSWRTIRRSLLGLACLVTLWALFCTEENIRGKHAWDKYRRETEAQGEQLEYKTFLPKPIPDEQNFAATPLIKSWFVRSNNVYVGFGNWRKDNYGMAEDSVASSQAKGDSGNRHFLDLIAWGTAFDAVGSGTLAKRHKIEAGKLDRESRAKAAPSVLEALKTNEAIFAELRAVSQRPYSQYPVNWDVEDPFSILLPHLGSVRNVCRRLQLKACAELAIAHSDDALADIRLMFRLIDSIRDEPFLISHLVRVACLQLAVDSVWEGLAEQRWSDAQLQELQVRLQSCDLVGDVRRPFEAERTAGIVVADLIRKHGLGYFTGSFGGGSPSSSDARVANWIGVLLPTSGWLYFEQINVCRAYQTLMDEAIDPSRRRVFPDRTEADTRDINRELSNSTIPVFIHHRALASLLLPALDRIILKAAVGQTIADQAAIACALERFRLATGRFPDTLDALVPRFISPLPHDVINGEPYKYRLTAGGQFVLYSVGWNEKDDGGVPGRNLFDEKEGDWVWRYPPWQ
jgi:hypothetical protein